jgi:hypothetical protein
VDDPPQPEPLDSLEGLRALAARARSDPSALPELRRALDLHPEIWRRVGDLAARAEQLWVELIAGPDVLAREALLHHLEALKVELAGPSPSPLERLLVERVAACWLQINHADAAAALARDVSIKQAEFAIKRQDRAHRRHLSAVAALATVRRLLPTDPPRDIPPPEDDDPAREPVTPALLALHASRAVPAEERRPRRRTAVG